MVFSQEHRQLKERTVALQFENHHLTEALRNDRDQDKATLSLLNSRLKAALQDREGKLKAANKLARNQQKALDDLLRERDALQRALDKKSKGSVSSSFVLDLEEKLRLMTERWEEEKQERAKLEEELEEVHAALEEAKQNQNSVSGSGEDVDQLIVSFDQGGLCPLQCFSQMVADMIRC